MTQKKNKQETPQSRRQFLEQLGGIGGSAAVYQAVVRSMIFFSLPARPAADWQHAAAG
ncbi:MAG: hypothetical protein ISP88_14640 [Pseudomonadales bacterium]|nr:hypothetical protein [Pseudomonadales bacterium]